MLFAISYSLRPNVSEDSLERSLQLFAHWQPPAGFAFKSHYAAADGNGGLALVETDSPAAALEVTSAWSNFFEFRLVPLVELDQAMQIRTKVLRWRQSVQ